MQLVPDGTKQNVFSSLERKTAVTGCANGRMDARNRTINEIFKLFSDNYTIKAGEVVDAMRSYVAQFHEK